MNPRLKQTGFRWAMFFSFWTLLGVSFASQFYLSSSNAGWGISWTDALKSSLGDWYVFGLLSLPVIWLSRHFILQKGAWGQSLFIHLAGCLIFSTLYVLLRTWTAQFLALLAGEAPPFRALFQPLFLKTFQYNVWVYWVIVAVTHAFDYYQKFHERELRSAELERSLVEAKLKSLQIQLNPHFLFNTLHSISALMHRDVEEADAMLAKLSGLLRKALDSTDQQEVTLREELSFLEQYLEIEKTRFGDRLQIEIEIDPGVKNALIPNLILQPIIENAIKHGIEPHARPGKITLRAFKEHRNTILEVTDNGEGIPQTPSREGIGLSNSRTRLKVLYGGDDRLQMINLQPHGLTVRVTIPARA